MKGVRVQEQTLLLVPTCYVLRSSLFLSEKRKEKCPMARYCSGILHYNAKKKAPDVDGEIFFLEVKITNAAL
jgi:hypothetical protein